jgi:hypothetical protein
VAGLWRGGDHGDETQETSATDECHDITVFPSAGIAAGACSGNGIVFDIKDPLRPRRIDSVVDKGFAYWHSVTFNNDGTRSFTDEWRRGARPCRAHDPFDWGADAVYDLVDGKLQYRSHFKMPAPQVAEENCVAHNGSIVPVPGRDIMVQSWYQGGISVWDFTDSAAPVEIAYFDRGPIDEKELVLAGYWSSYWYDGFVYATEIQRGLDVFALQPSEFLSENEIAAAGLADQGGRFNPQQLGARGARSTRVCRSVASRGWRRRVSVDARRYLGGSGFGRVAPRGECEGSGLGGAVERARTESRYERRRCRYIKEKARARGDVERAGRATAVGGGRQANATRITLPRRRFPSAIPPRSGTLAHRPVNPGVSQPPKDPV